jgi:hypothetical protein
VTKLVLIVVYRIVKHWIFVVVHPSDKSNLLISIGYSLSFVIELDSSNLSIGFYKKKQ